MFNQLLGINNGHVIVGYFGDGTAVPNNGYVLVPANHYSVENFTNLVPPDFASQTQAIGINTRKFPDIVGFYTDNATDFTHGFLDSNGVQTPIDDPAGSPPTIAAPVQNLLGINNFDEAAGLSTPERNYIGGRSKNTSQAEMEGWFSSVTSKLSFPVRSMSLLSRPDRLPRATARSVGDGRSGATRSTASMASTGPSPQ